MGAYETSNTSWVQNDVYCACGEATASWFGGMNLAGTDRLGSAESGYGYYPYGEEYTPPSGDGDDFATYYHDADTGLDYARNRYYSSILGRFLSADPTNGGVDLADPGSFNKYVYVGGDPVNRNDPTGLFDGDTQCLDPIYAASHAQCQGPGSPWCDAHPGDENCTGDGNDGGCLNGDPGTPFAPGGGPTPCPPAGGGPPPPSAPPPLTCTLYTPQFSRANSNPKNGAGEPGWYAAATFNFSASGGVGDYYWTERQSYDNTLSASGRIVDQNRGTDPPLYSLQPLPNRITYKDWPGLEDDYKISRRGVYNLIITLTLDVTVYSGTQSAACGSPIPWFVDITVVNNIGSGFARLGFPQ